MAAPRPTSEYTFEAKPHEPAVRPFHRLRSPSYDRAVDAGEIGRTRKRRPSGRARESGARNGTDFVDSGLTEEILKKILDGLIALLGTVAPVVLAVNAAIAKLTGKDPLDEVAKAIAKAAARGIEGALFERFMRSLPQWVPVGRHLYDNAKFTYDEDGTPRDVDKEEEREVEGILSASFQLSNDLPLTQWTRYARWSFHVVPLPGYRYLVGEGNGIDTAVEGEQMRDDFLDPRMVQIYRFIPGQEETGAIECLWDVGAFSHPRGDPGGTGGVMFDPSWPWWPAAGDHFWAVGRWAYDCTRPVHTGLKAKGPNGQEEDLELFPTMIHPVRAFAAARLEGFKFPENARGVTSTKFFFFSGSEGGYADFHPVKDREGGTHRAPPFDMRDRDFEFIVDLPAHELGKSPYPIGRTPEFLMNTLVIRPRLLMHVRFAPFATGDNAPAFRRDTRFHTVMPKVEILRPADPTQRPTQAKVTVPMTALPARREGEPEVYAFELSLGWHDPTGDDARKLKRVRVHLGDAHFHRQGGQMRLKSSINGHWRELPSNVTQENFDQDAFFRTPPRRGVAVHVADVFLPEEARIVVTTHGTWIHGFGEKLEDDTLETRRLRFGGLIPIPQAMQDALDRIDQLLAAGKELSPDQKDTLEKIEKFKKTLQRFIGVNKVVEWPFDLDATRSNDVPVEQQRVSIIARELWAKLLPVFNRQNVPMGWTDFLSTEDTPSGEEHGLKVLNSPKECGTVAGLIAKQRALGGPVPVKVVARQADLIGSGNLIGEQIAGGSADYSYTLFLEVSDQV